MFRLGVRKAEQGAIRSTGQRSMSGDALVNAGVEPGGAVEAGADDAGCDSGGCVCCGDELVESPPPHPASSTIAAITTAPLPHPERPVRIDHSV